MPEVNDLLAGRYGSDWENYCYVCYFFVRRVVGCSRFDQTISTGGKFSSIATASDEAFTLSVLANNFDKWKYRCRGNPPLPEGEKPPTSKFTSGVGRKAKKYQGWNLEGLTYFGNLNGAYQKMRRTKEDEKKIEEFDKLFTAYWCLVTGRQPAGQQQENESIESQAANLAMFDYDFPEDREPLQRASV
jgi:hypothetical protein